jgi:hypothetical protein
VPDEGTALSGIARPAKGRGNTVPSGGAKPQPGQPCSVTSYQIATVERREGAPALRQGGRGAFAKVPQETCAISALRSLTYGEGKENREALAPRLLGRGR